jgi:hypothetical protein
VTSELFASINELTEKIDQIEKDIQYDTSKVIEEYKTISEKMNEHERDKYKEFLITELKKIEKQEKELK